MTAANWTLVQWLRGLTNRGKLGCWASLQRKRPATLGGRYGPEELVKHPLINVTHKLSKLDQGPTAGLVWPMSALGQKQTFAAQNGMSALRPKADIGLVQIMLPPTSSPCPVTPRVLSETDRCGPLRSGTARAPSALLPRRLRAGRRALYSTLMPQSWRRPQHQKQTSAKAVSAYPWLTAPPFMH